MGRKAVAVLCFAVFLFGTAVAFDVPERLTIRSPAGEVEFPHLEHAARMGCDRCHHAGRNVALVRMWIGEGKEGRKALRVYFRCRECHEKPGAVRRGCRGCHRREWKRVFREKRKRGWDAETARELADRRVPVTCGGCHRGARARAQLLMEVLP